MNSIENRTEFEPIDLAAEGYSEKHCAETIRRIICNAVLEYCVKYNIPLISDASAWTIARNSFNVRRKHDGDKNVWTIECDWHRFEWELGL